MSLQGTLSTLGITELLEFLSGRSSSGQLDINTASGTASYLLVNGTIGVAEYNFVRAAGESAAEATYYVLAEIDGEFFFEEVDVTDADEGVDVPTLLGETAEIAERWLDVEAVIPTTSHVLVRNSELDSSVTIKPEWWKVLEVLGAGQSSAELATKLDLGILDTSTQALDMVNAGLLLSTEPGEVTESAPLEFADALAADVAHDLATDVEQSDVAETETETELVSVETDPVAESEISASEPVESAVEEAPIVTEETIAEAPAPPIMAAPVDPAPVDPVAEPAVLGFSKHLEDDPVTEPISAPVFGDDGWSTNHFYEEPVQQSSPFAAAPEVETAAPDLFEEPAPMAFEEAAAPMTFEEPALMAFEETPAPPAFDDIPAPGSAEPAAASPGPVDQFDSSSLYGLDASFTGVAEPVDSNAMAGEVMSDLAFLNDDLDDQMPAPVTPAGPAQASAPAMPAQASPIPAATSTVGDADPFGSLSDLVVDDDESSDDDRGSVLKFLRRD